MTIVPTAWLLICTLTAGWQKLFHPNPAIGFLAHAGKFGDALAQGQILAPAKTVEEMQRIIFNDYVDAGAVRAVRRRGAQHDPVRPGRRLAGSRRAPRHRPGGSHVAVAAQ